MTIDEEELARQIWELGMKDPPAQKQGGYQCLSVWDGFRCIMTDRHVGKHRAIFADQNGTRTRRLEWTDADISPVPIPDPPDCDHPDPSADPDPYPHRRNEDHASALRALSVVITDIRALLTDIRDDLRCLPQVEVRRRS